MRLYFMRIRYCAIRIRIHVERLINMRYYHAEHERDDIVTEIY